MEDKGKKKMKQKQCFQFATCLGKENKERSSEGHLRDCPIDQGDEWCLARRDATALLI